jgi:hypothetical protein
MKRIAICTGVVALLVAASIWFASRPAPPDLDEKATSMREKLRSLCDSFDFQLKEQVGGGVVRPINCKGPAGRNAHLRLFVFTDTDTRDAWLDEVLLSSESHGPSETSFHGDDWAVISLSDEITTEAKRRLQR